MHNPFRQILRSILSLAHKIEKNCTIFKCWFCLLPGYFLTAPTGALLWTRLGNFDTPDLHLLNLRIELFYGWSHIILIELCFLCSKIIPPFSIPHGPENISVWQQMAHNCIYIHVSLKENTHSLSYQNIDIVRVCWS